MSPNRKLLALRVLLDRERLSDAADLPTVGSA